MGWKADVGETEAFAVFVTGTGTGVSSPSLSSVKSIDCPLLLVLIPGPEGRGSRDGPAPGDVCSISDTGGVARYYYYLYKTNINRKKGL